MGKGGATEESLQAMADGNARLEQGIEDLRQKYALKAEMEAKQKEIDDREKRTQEALACAACVEKERVDPTVSMEMEDPDLEAVRQARMEALKSKAKALKRHIEAGGGEYREIAEDDFLKEVRPQQCFLLLLLLLFCFCFNLTLLVSYCFTGQVYNSSQQYEATFW